jgi:hypothetical protein
MANGKGQLLIRATVERADRAARELDQAARRVDRAIRDEFQHEGELNSDATEAMRDVAPVDTGLLQEVIEGRLSYGSGAAVLTIHSPVRDPATNYPYTGVSRFGHRRQWIYPKHRASPDPFRPGSTTIAGDPKSKFFLDKGHAPALAVHLFGRYESPMFFARVRGYKPAADWVEAGLPAANEAAADALDRIGRRVVFGLV